METHPYPLGFITSQTCPPPRPPPKTTAYHRLPHVIVHHQGPSLFPFPSPFPRGSDSGKLEKGSGARGGKAGWPTCSIMTSEVEGQTSTEHQKLTFSFYRIIGKVVLFNGSRTSISSEPEEGLQSSKQTNHYVCSRQAPLDGNAPTLGGQRQWQNPGWRAIMSIEQSNPCKKPSAHSPAKQLPNPVLDLAPNDTPC